MIFLIRTLFSLSLLWANENYRISAISNLNDFKTYLAPKVAEAPVLVELNIKTLQRIQITLPDEIASLETLGLIQVDATLLVISQWTKGDGKNPLVYSYREKKWSKVGELNCVSFDKLNVKGEQLIVECEEVNPNGPGYKYSSRSLKLPWKVSKNKAFELPLGEDSQKDFRIIMKGPPSEWTSLSIEKKKGSKWTLHSQLSASDVLKKQP